MNIEELQEILSEMNIRDDAYSLSGGTPSEAYCLNQVKDEWEIYYSEKGQKSGFQCLKSEDLACREFLKLIKADNTLLRNISVN